MNTKSLALAALAGGLALSMTACGSSSPAKAASTTAPQDGTKARPGGAPGVNGLVAEVSGSTAQVQSASSQTAVTWTASTTFSQEVTVTAAAVQVGDCVQASRARPTSSANPSAPSSSAIDAATVRIISAAGGCTAASLGGSNPGVSPRTFPSGAPSGSPGGRRGGLGAFMTIGTVSSASSTGFVVTPVARPGATASPVTVTVSSSTTYTETQSATATDVKTGICMSANGTTDSTGALTAKRITLSQPVNGTCTAGGRFGDGFPGGQGVPRNG